ncbi:MAG: Na+/H+ antiporter NhaC [Acidobacteriota bacterium]
MMLSAEQPADRAHGDALSRTSAPRTVTFGQALLPIVVLMSLVLYGLILRPQVFDRPAFPLEVIFVFAATFAIAELRWLGHRFVDVQASIVAKLQRALPAFFIFFSIGLLIASWTISGTIPMLIFYGLKLVDPRWLYLLAFLVPVVFSMLTGTSWGSIGTVGIVLLGMASAMGGHLGITAGAVVGGAYFGDKLSPLSDTTNIAALAADVDLFDHIRSMLYTTVPSAFVAALAYAVLGGFHPPSVAAADLDAMRPFLDGLTAVFTFHPLLLVPPVLVLIGSIRRQPTVPTLIVSTLVACGLTLAFQRFTISDVLQTLHRGFDLDMAPWATGLPEQVVVLLERGGLYALIDAIVIAFMVFAFIGAMDHVGAIETVVHRVFRFARSRRATIFATLGASAATNALTANQYATSFIVADAFKAKFDRLRIPRKVLSRSLEDTGTMLESVVPWSPTAVFVAATLGVSFAAYAPWQILSMVNFIVAPTLAILGIGCFYHEVDGEADVADQGSAEDAA